MDTSPVKYNHLLLSNIQEALFKAIRGKSPEKTPELINAILEPLLPSLLQGKNDEFHDALGSLYCQPKSILKAAVSAIVDTLMESSALRSNFENTLLRYLAVQMRSNFWREKNKRELLFSDIEHSCRKRSEGDESHLEIDNIVKIKHHAPSPTPQDELIRRKTRNFVHEQLRRLRDELNNKSI